MRHLCHNALSVPATRSGEKGQLLRDSISISVHTESGLVLILTWPPNDAYGDQSSIALGEFWNLYNNESSAAATNTCSLPSGFAMTAGSELSLKVPPRGSQPRSGVPGPVSGLCHKALSIPSTNTSGVPSRFSTAEGLVSGSISPPSDW